MKVTVARFLPELLRHVFKPPVTVRYPFQKSEVPKDFRGTPILNPGRCIACRACERDCPASAIEIVQVSAEEKKFRMTIHNDRCVHCGQCAESCPTAAITMNIEYELAAPDRHDLKAVYEYTRAVPSRPQPPPTK